MSGVCVPGNEIRLVNEEVPEGLSGRDVSGCLRHLRDWDLP
jgi:hypothetical protein